MLRCCSSLKNFRNFVAFWIFGLCNNFAYVIMLSAAIDIMSKKNNKFKSNSDHCQDEITNRRCQEGEVSLGPVLLADIIPALVMKLLYSVCVNRIPMTLRHTLICLSQGLSFIIVSFSDSVAMNLVGVVMASGGSGMGESAYLGLSSYYSCDECVAWGSGTGGSGLIGAGVYAALTESSMGNLSPETTLLIMLIIPIIFYITYFTILVPSPGIYRAQLLSPKTWIVPKEALYSTSEDKSAIKKSSKGKCSDFEQQDNEFVLDKTQSSIDSTQSSKTLSLTFANDKEIHTFKWMYKTTLPLLKYMIPLTIVYWTEYLINMALTPFLVFKCIEGFHLSKNSQYRWYQVLYQLGVFISRSSVNCITLPFYIIAIAIPIIQTTNLIFFTFDAIYRFVPHISITFAIILFEGMLGGSSYVNTFYIIHNEVKPSKKREFSLTVTTLSDAIGIVLAGFTAFPFHLLICWILGNRYPLVSQRHLALMTTPDPQMTEFTQN